VLIDRAACDLDDGERARLFRSAALRSPLGPGPALKVIIPRHRNARTGQRQDMTNLANDVSCA
jgi:hypothetical protein